MLKPSPSTCKEPETTGHVASARFTSKTQGEISKVSHLGESQNSKTGTLSGCGAVVAAVWYGGEQLTHLQPFRTIEPGWFSLSVQCSVNYMSCLTLCYKIHLVFLTNDNWLFLSLGLWFNYLTLCIANSRFSFTEPKTCVYTLPLEWSRKKSCDITSFTTLWSSKSSPLPLFPPGTSVPPHSAPHPGEE